MNKQRWMQSAALALGLTLGAVAMQAQDTNAAGQAANQAAPAVAQSQGASTSLTAEQKQQLHELRASARDQAAIIRHDQSLTPAQRQAKLKELRASTRQQMKSVLTPEQQQSFAARRQEHRSAMAAKLGLTADQQSKMKELFQSTRQQRQQVLANSGLTSDQKATQLAQIRQSAKSQMATILTPEQMQQWHQMRGMHRGKARSM